MKERNTASSIFYYVNALNIAILVVPICGFITAYIVYYNYNENRYVFLPSEADFLTTRPEGRIMIMFNSLELIMISFMLYLRHEAFFILKKNQTTHSRRNSIFLMLMRLLSYSGIISRYLTLVFPLKIFRFFYLTALHISYISFAAYFFLNDILCQNLNYECKSISQGLTYSFLASFLAFFALRFYSPKGFFENEEETTGSRFDFVNFTISSFCGLIGSLSLCAKLFFMKFDIPEVGIRLSKRITF